MTTVYRLKWMLQGTAIIAVVAVSFALGNATNLLIAGVGGFWIYGGLSRGAQYYPLLNQAPLRMNVLKVENRNHRQYFPDYVAIGLVKGHGSAIAVPIFAHEFRQLHPGDSLEVYALASGRWIDHAKLEESRPLFNVLGLHFSWHLPAGILILAAWFLLVPYLRRRRGPLGNNNSGRNVRSHE